MPLFIFLSYSINTPKIHTIKEIVFKKWKGGFYE